MKYPNRVCGICGKDFVKVSYKLSYFCADCSKNKDLFDQRLVYIKRIYSRNNMVRDKGAQYNGR